MATDTTKLTESIPSVAVVREQLARAIREVKFLRQLLRLAEQAERSKDQKGVAHA